VTDESAAEKPLPLVSFIMSVYAGNDAAELKRVLVSAVGQDYPSVELVLVIDGPVPDELRQAINEVQRGTNVPICVIALGRNRGLGPALNAAISAAKGEFLARADADDYSMPDRVRVQAEYLTAHPEVDVVGCLMEEVFEDGSANYTRMPANHEACVAEFVRRDPIHHPTAVFRRRFFEKAGLYSGEKCDDSALWLAGIKAGCRFANVDMVLYRTFLDRKFFSRRKNLRWIWWVFENRLRIIRELDYGIKGYFWAIFRVAVMLLPRPLLQRAYRLRSKVWTHA